jgi:hypothetical protein
MRNFSVISWWEQVAWWGNDVRFVLDQHVELDFWSASLLRQQDRHPLNTLILFRANKSLLSYFLVLRA